MTRSKIMPRLTLLLALLLFEVIALHLNRRPLQLVAKEIRHGEPGEPYSPRLVCELTNDRITPIRYMAVSDDFPAYEIILDGHMDRQTWCTSTSDHWLAPFSRVTLEIPVPKRRFHDCRISVMCESTSLLTWLLWPSADYERASMWGRDDELLKRE